MGVPQLEQNLAFGGIRCVAVRTTHRVGRSGRRRSACRSGLERSAARSGLRTRERRPGRLRCRPIPCRRRAPPFRCRLPPRRLRRCLSSAAPTPYSRNPPASRVYALSLRKPLRVFSSSGERLMVTFPRRVILTPYGVNAACTSASSADSISAVRRRFRAPAISRRSVCARLRCARPSGSAPASSRSRARWTPAECRPR